MKYKKDSLGDRMKTYENQFRLCLDPKEPVIIRIDGRAFHTFTKGFQRPFDSVFANAIMETMKYLCENIQNCVFGYTQSDEITLVLVNDFNPNSCAWFDNNLQKIASVSASMATRMFNKSFLYAIKEYDFQWRHSLTPQSCEIQEEHRQYIERLRESASKGAMFDARVFTVPKDEIINCLIRDSNTLAALEIGGVDNWDWYGYSIKDYVNTWKRDNPDCWAGMHAEDVDIETMSMYELEEYRTVADLMNSIIGFVDTTLG